MVGRGMEVGLNNILPGYARATLTFPLPVLHPIKKPTPQKNKRQKNFKRKKRDKKNTNVRILITHQKQTIVCTTDKD